MINQQQFHYETIRAEFGVKWCCLSGHIYRNMTQWFQPTWWQRTTLSSWSLSILWTASLTTKRGLESKSLTVRKGNYVVGFLAKLALCKIRTWWSIPSNIFEEVLRVCFILTCVRTRLWINMQVMKAELVTLLYDYSTLCRLTILLHLWHFNHIIVMTFFRIYSLKR